MSDTDKEIQKTLEDLKKRAEEFQAGGNYSSGLSHFDSPTNWKLILTIVGVILALVISVLFYTKSKAKKMTKPPPSVQQMLRNSNSIQ